MVLSRGIIGDQSGTPKVACPLHKKTFSLETGECMSGDEYQIQTFDVKVEDEQVYLLLDPIHGLPQLQTTTSCNHSCADAH